MRSFAILASLFGSVNAGLSGLTAEQADAINTELEKSCGQACVAEWKKLQQKYDGQDVQVALQQIMGSVETEMQAMKASLTKPGTLASFLEEGKKVTAGWNPLDTPCFDKASCTIVEVLANRSNYARVATMAIYQAINMPVHIIAVVARVLCGCLSVYNQSFCLLGPVPIYGTAVCETAMSTSNMLFGMSTKIWESVKTQTKLQKVIGQPLIASR